jgi:hypothetical protein
VSDVFDDADSPVQLPPDLVFEVSEEKGEIRWAVTMMND